jgi:N-acetylglucosaminyldiphosphoundecaprenol N-acetyl-beta-D-mannosaminyltransferase
MEKIKIISLSVANLSFAEQISQICRWAKTKASKVVCCANVHMVIEAYRDQEFSKQLEQADLITADGMPLVWYTKKRAGIALERVAGMDLLPALCQQAAKENLKLFFVGSTQEVLLLIKQRLSNDYPQLQLVGLLAPPFRALSLQEETELVEKINASGAELVFVSFGCPKQEKWMLRNRNKIKAVMVGVGGAFPVFAGKQKRAPLWMQKIGLEWLYRLMKEPRRLLRRYLVTNLYFIWLVIAEALGLLKTY